MDFKELTEQEISNFIVNDPRLVYMGFSDSDIAYIYDNNSYECHPGSQYIGIIDKDEGLVCVLKWEQFEYQVVNVHAYIASRFHGTGMATKTYNFMYQHFAENTDTRKVVTFIPEPCVHVIKAAEKHGFKQEGCITKGCMWRQEVTDLYIYGLDIVRNNQ